MTCTRLKLTRAAPLAILFLLDPAANASILYVDDDAPPGADSEINYTCLQGLTGVLGGSGNVGSDPLFRMPIDLDGIAGTLDDDLRLQAGSPCIDAGNNAAVFSDLADLDGDADTAEPTPLDLASAPRFFDDPLTPDTGSGTPPIVDMGAYEYVPLTLTLDIRPGDCPNQINPRSKGVLKMAILGTETFDVTRIDRETLLLRRAGVTIGVKPKSISVEDAAAPTAGPDCTCQTPTPDGHADLVLTYRTADVVKELRLDSDPAGTTVILHLLGQLDSDAGGSPLMGSDCVTLVQEAR